MTVIPLPARQASAAAPLRTGPATIVVLRDHPVALRRSRADLGTIATLALVCCQPVLLAALIGVVAWEAACRALTSCRGES